MLSRRRKSATGPMPNVPRLTVTVYGSPFTGLGIPIQDLSAVPDKHSLVLSQPAKHVLHVLDAVGYAGNIGVQCDRHHLGAFLAFAVHTIEIVHAPCHEFSRLM